MKLVNPGFLTSSCKIPNYSLSLNPFKFSSLSVQPTLHSHNQTRGSLRFCYSSCSSRSASIKSTMCASSPFVHVRDHIDLTDKEKQIFDCLRQAIRHGDVQTQPRVAGVWVRDKLLGKECYDIDIALDNMSGNGFCRKVNEYLVSNGKMLEE